MVNHYENFWLNRLDLLMKPVLPECWKITNNVTMEPMDGWQNLLTLKKNHDPSRIPVIMVSGNQYLMIW